MSILGISLMTVGVMLYGKLNGGFNDEPLFNKDKDSTTDIGKETYNYLINLSYEEIYEYVCFNNVLNHYKDEICNNCNMQDKHQLCSYIAHIANIEHRPFNDKYIYY